MLTPYILSKINTKAQLSSKIAAANAQLDSMNSGEDISSIGEASLNVQYRPGATKDELEQDITNMVEALQILDPTTFGDELLRPNQKFVY